MGHDGRWGAWTCAQAGHSLEILFRIYRHVFAEIDEGFIEAALGGA
ncbi:hypothetical protein LFM09_03415 [Lentzea alba]